MRTKFIFPCLQVYSPPGTLIGTVEQNWSILYPNYSLKDAAGNEVLKIKGPFCTYSCCGDVEFMVRDQYEFGTL